MVEYRTAASIKLSELGTFALRRIHFNSLLVAKKKPKKMHDVFHHEQTLPNNAFEYLQHREQGDDLLYHIVASRVLSRQWSGCL